MVKDTRYEEHYKREWIGFIRYQKNVVKVSRNFGCFLTLESYDNLPVNLRVSLRVILSVLFNFKLFKLNLSTT